MLPSWSLAERSFRLETFRHTLNLLKEFPSIIPAVMDLNFLALRFYKFMLLPRTSGVLLSSSRGTSLKQHELQLTSMWPGMRRSSQLLPGDIHRQTKLTSAVYDIQPFPQQQCVRSGQCVPTAY